MITSERQYNAAQEKLRMLQVALQVPGAAGVPPDVVEAARGQTSELAQEVEDEIREYEALRKGDVREIKIDTLDELFTAPIRYRIARHWTLEEFGNKVHKDWRQIKRYEEAGYQNATVTTLREILQNLEFSIRGKLELTPRKEKPARGAKV